VAEGSPADKVDRPMCGGDNEFLKAAAANTKAFLNSLTNSLGVHQDAKPNFLADGSVGDGIREPTYAS